MTRWKAVRPVTSADYGALLAIEQLIVPLDGTPLSDRALPAAVTLARRLHTQVVLVRALAGEPMHAASLHLARVEQELRAKGVRTESSLLYQDPVDALLDVATHGSYGSYGSGGVLPVSDGRSTVRAGSSVMLLSSGLGTAKRSLTESVTAGVLASAAIPMLVLGAPGTSPFETQGSQGLRVLALVPGDSVTAPAATDHGHAPVSRAVAYAELLARTFDGRAFVLGTRRDPLCRISATQAQPRLAPCVATEPVMSVLARLARAQTERPEALLLDIHDDELDVETLACVTRAAADLLVVPVAGAPAERQRQLPAIAYLLAASGVPLLAVP